MMILSLIKLVGASKKLAVQRLLVVYKPDIVLFQETMCKGDRAVEFESSFLKKWAFCLLHANDLSGGLVIGWNNNIDIIVLSKPIDLVLWSLIKVGH